MGKLCAMVGHMLHYSAVEVSALPRRGDRTSLRLNATEMLQTLRLQGEKIIQLFAHAAYGHEPQTTRSK